MKNNSSIVFTGDIGFDRYMYKKWDDEELISEPGIYKLAGEYVCTEMIGRVQRN